MKEKREVYLKNENNIIEYTNVIDRIYPPGLGGRSYK